MQTNSEVEKQSPFQEINSKITSLSPSPEPNPVQENQLVEEKLKEQGKTEEKEQELKREGKTEEKEQESKREGKTEEKEQEIQKVEEKQQMIQNESENNNEHQEGEGQMDNNEQNWTDATESVAADEDNDIWVLDDDIINQMEIDSAEEEEGEEHQKGDNEGQSKGKMKEDDPDLEELEDQFVKGGESDEDWRLGQHTDFCIAVAVAQDGKSVFSGGGDDLLLCYRLNQDKWEQFYSLKHSETVSKIELSHDNKYVVTLTDEEIYVTDIVKLESNKLDVEEPADVVCHKQGGVIVVAHGYAVSIYNLKGLELYSSYNLDLPPLSLCFSENGKQIVAACESKIRIISPKTGEIIKVAGNEFHKEEISEIATSASIALSGCIGGEVFVSGLAKGNILGKFESFKGVINCLGFTDNYALIAPQGDGLYWANVNTFKIVFHSPSDVSVSAVCKVHSQNHLAVGDIDGNIHLLDSRAPMNIIKKIRAGNTIHSLTARGSQLYAACEDGYVRVFDISKHL